MSTTPFGLCCIRELIPQRGKALRRRFGAVHDARLRRAVLSSKSTGIDSVRSASTGDFRKSSQTAVRMSARRLNTALLSFSSHEILVLSSGIGFPSSAVRSLSNISLRSLILTHGSIGRLCEGQHRRGRHSKVVTAPKDHRVGQRAGVERHTIVFEY